jgi:hypothetical protein
MEAMRPPVLPRPSSALGGAARAVALAVVAAGIVACGGGTVAPSTGARLPVEMHLLWVMDSAFPATVAVHEAPTGQALYETRSYEADVTPEVGPEIADAILRAPYGEPARFVALLRNESDEALRFWVAPHLPTPHVSEQGLMMFCLCTGEVYEVPAHGSWTRVMEFGVTRRAELDGRPIALTHVIVPGETPRPSSAHDGGTR